MDDVRAKNVIRVFAQAYSDTVASVRATFKPDTKVGRDYSLTDSEVEAVNRMSREIVAMAIFQMAELFDELSTESRRPNLPVLAIRQHDGELADAITEVFGGSGEFAGWVQESFAQTLVGSPDEPKEWSLGDRDNLRFD